MFKNFTTALAIFSVSVLAVQPARDQAGEFELDGKTALIGKPDRPLGARQGAKVGQADSLYANYDYGQAD